MNYEKRILFILNVCRKFFACIQFGQVNLGCLRARLYKNEVSLKSIATCFNDERKCLQAKSKLKFINFHPVRSGHPYQKWNFFNAERNEQIDFMCWCFAYLEVFLKAKNFCHCATISQKFPRFCSWNDDIPSKTEMKLLYVV